MLPQMRRTLTITLDMDWLYRRLGLRIANAVGATVHGIDQSLRRAFLESLEAAIASVRRYCAPEGALARSAATGTATLWVALFLGLSLMIYFLRG